jgi:DNA-directed RNA polymerase specialized sigma54-like protein
MARPPPKKRFALDANILFDLAEEKDYAHTLREVLQELGAFLEVPPTVIQELVFAAQTMPGPQGQTAGIVLQSLLSWKLIPIPLRPIEHGIAMAFAERLIRKGYLPENEENDGLLLAESSLAEIPVLITRDQHLLDIPNGVLAVELNAADLFQVQVMHPRPLLRALAH